MKNQRGNKKENYIAFIDQNLALNRDKRLLRHENYVDKENYNKDLAIFLKNIEKYFKKKVVFLVHPRTKKGEKYLKNFKNLEFGKTAKLIRDSSFVITHDSTAINFGVLFRKPILLANMDSWKHTFKEKNLFLTAKILGLKVVNIKNKKFDNYQNIKINNKLYDKFIKNYIKFKGPDINSWEIVSKKLLELN